MKVFPTPTGPRTKTLWPASTKRSEHSSSQTWWSKVTFGGGVPVLEAHVGSSPAAAGSAGRPKWSLVVVTSSERTSSKNSAWPSSSALASARRSGRVSRQRPSFTWRSRAFSSAEMVGAGVLTPAPRRSWRRLRAPVWLLRCLGIGVHRYLPLTAKYSAGRAKRPVAAGPGRAAARLALGGALEHPADERDVEGLGLGGPGAGALDPLGPPLLDQAQQRVDLAHLGPRQRVVEEHRGVGADRPGRARRPCAADAPVSIA